MSRLSSKVKNRITTQALGRRLGDRFAPAQQTVAGTVLGRGLVAVNGRTVHALGVDDLAPGTTVGLTNVGSPGMALYSTERGGVGLQFVSGLASGGGGTSDHGQLAGLNDDDHPQYLNTIRGGLLFVPLARRVDTPAAGGLQGGGALSDDLELSLNPGVAGAGLTFDNGLLSVVPGEGLEIETDAIGLKSSVAGAGLAYAAGVISVTPGEGLEIETDAIGLKSSVAGEGLLYAAGVINVAVANTGAVGLSVEADAVRLTSSSNPGASAKVLATSADGSIYLDSNLLYVDAPNNRIGINRTPGGAALDVVAANNADHTQRLAQKAGQTGRIWRVENAAGDELIVLDSVGNLQSGSPGFVSGLTGWQMTPWGDLEANNGRFRGELHATVMVFDEINVRNGTELITPAGGALELDAALTSSSTPKAISVRSTAFAEKTLTVRSTAFTERVLTARSIENVLAIKNPYTGHYKLFRAGETLRAKVWTGTAITDVWMRVNNAVDMGTYWAYYVQIMSGSLPATLTAGAAVADYGRAGDGAIRLSADDPYGPLIDIFTIGERPWLGEIYPHVRLGRLDGVGLPGISGVRQWGLVAGLNLADANSPYFVASNLQLSSYRINSRWNDGENDTVQIDASGRVRMGTNVGQAATTFLDANPALGTLTIGSPASAGAVTIYGQVFLPDGEAVESVHWRGAWVSGATYRRQDAVEYAGRSYIAVTAHTAAAGNAPGVGAVWQLMADQGATGATGATGPQGPAGPAGPQGSQGIQGPAGANGASQYFHVAYASNSTGTVGFNQVSGAYIGTYVDSNPTDSNDPAAYTWQQFVGSQGPTGSQGIPGANGANGQTSYLHIKYSNDGGTTFTANGGETPGTWLGQYVDFTATDSSSTAAYTWSKIEGPTGPTGPQGSQGIQGPAGANGTSQYFHVAYASNSTGTVGFNQVSGAYIGTYVDSNPTDSNDPAAYTWQQFVGSQGPTGSQGIPGANGANGQTSYLHIKYSNDGGTTFTANGGETPGTWLGQYVDFTATDSSSTAAYTWSKIEGPTGPTGPQGSQGIQGPAGANGTSQYFHVAYASNSTGTVGFNQVSGAYIGTYVDSNPTDSNDPAAYTWQQFVGSQGPTGSQGIPGANGANGQTSYLHIKYSNDGGTTFTANGGETPGTWLGQYVDFTATDSSSTAAYTWSKIEGPAGAAGANAKLATLVASSLIFAIDSSGIAAPTSITLTATGQNVTGSPVFTVTAGTATLTGTGNTRSLAYTGMLSEAVTIQIAWDGVTDTVTIGKVRGGADGATGQPALTVLLSNEAHVLPAASDGVVANYAGSGTDITVYEGATALAAGGSGAGTFVVALVSAWPLTVRSAAFVERAISVRSTAFAEKTLTARSLPLTPGAISYAASTATVSGHSAISSAVDLVALTYAITVTRSTGQTATIYRTQTISKSKAGPAGATGATGPTGPQGPTGPTGPQGPPGLDNQDFAFLDSSLAALQARSAGAGMYIVSDCIGYYSGGPAGSFSFYLGSGGDFKFGSPTAGSAIEYSAAANQLRGRAGATTHWYVDGNDGRMYAGGGAVMIDANGLSVQTTYASGRKMRFMDGAAVLGYFEGFADLDHHLKLSVGEGSGKGGEVTLAAYAGNTTLSASLSVGGGFVTVGAGGLRVGTTPVALDGHTHAAYAASSHTHDYAASSHTHNYAASTHTHDYAASSHTHAAYAALAGATFVGAVNMGSYVRFAALTTAPDYQSGYAVLFLLNNGNNDFQFRVKIRTPDGTQQVDQQIAVA